MLVLVKAKGKEVITQNLTSPGKAEAQAAAVVTTEILKVLTIDESRFFLFEIFELPLIVDILTSRAL